MNGHSRFSDFDGFVFHDPAREGSDRPWHEVYVHRTDQAGLILRRAYALAQQGRWDRMKSYLHWELDQPIYGDPAMGEVYKFRRIVQHVDSVDQLIHPHLVSARLRHEAGHTEEAMARVGWLLELLPADHRLYDQVATIYHALTQETTT